MSLVPLESDSMVPVSILMAALISCEISITYPDNELNLGIHTMCFMLRIRDRMINTCMVPSIIKFWKFSTSCRNAPATLMVGVYVIFRNLKELIKDRIISSIKLITIRAFTLARYFAAIDGN